MSLLAVQTEGIEDRVLSAQTVQEVRQREDSKVLGDRRPRPATAGSSCITPRAGEVMAADGVSGSQRAEQWREVEPWWRLGLPVGSRDE